MDFNLFNLRKKNNVKAKATFIFAMPTAEYLLMRRAKNGNTVTSSTTIITIIIPATKTKQKYVRSKRFRISANKFTQQQLQIYLLFISMSTQWAKSFNTEIYGLIKNKWFESNEQFRIRWKFLIFAWGKYVTRMRGVWTTSGKRNIDWTLQKKK